jgi:hypothetical protein
MKKPVLYSLVFLSIMVLSSCRKYQEGPSLSLRSKKARLCADWKVVGFLGVNREDAREDQECFINTSTICEYDIQPQIYDAFTDNCGNINSLIFGNFRITEMQVYFNPDNTFSISYYYDNEEFDRDASFAQCSLVYARKKGREVVQGIWDFSGNKEAVILSGFNFPRHFPALLHAFGVSSSDEAYHNKTVSASIIKLKEENVTLEFFYSSYLSGYIYSVPYRLELKNQGN